MKKWSIALLAMAILAAGAVSVSAAVDNTRPFSAQCLALTGEAALQGCDGIPDRDGTGNQYQGAGAAVSADTAGADTTPNDDCIPDKDGTGNQYGAGNSGNTQNCPNENCPADPDCDGIPDGDGTGCQYGHGNGGAANCANGDCPVNPDCDGTPSYDGAGARHHGGSRGNGHCKGQ